MAPPRRSRTRQPFLGSEVVMFSNGTHIVGRWTMIKNTRQLIPISAGRRRVPTAALLVALLNEAW
jgi:hypothetical protein